MFILNPYIFAPASTLLTNLRNVYKAENNANDSVGTNNGTGMGGLLYSSGKSNQSFIFNGSTAYIDFPNDTFKFTGDFSINLWVNIASSTTNSVFICNYFYQGGLGEAGWLLEHRNNGSLRFYMLTAPGSTTQLNYSYAGKYSGWHMLTLTKIGGTGACKMYVDGALVVNNSSPGAIYYNSFQYSTIGVCKYVGGTSGYVENGGKIDEVGLWTKELTATEVLDLYKCSLGNFYPFTITPALDSDACAFIGSASITDTTQVNAINQLVLDLKSANIWTKMKAIYPFVGGTASQHRFNLKDPRPVAGAFYLDFYGGGTHSLSGYQPDGATAYADTNLFPDTHLSPNSGFGFYSITNNSLTSSEMGALYYDMPSATNERMFQSVRTATVMYMGVNSNNVLSFSDTDSRGFYQAYRTDSSTIKTLKNTTLYTASSQYYIMPSISCYIGARNERYLAQIHSNKGLSFAYFQNNFTDADATALYNAVQTFNTTLGNGRAV